MASSASKKKMKKSARPSFDGRAVAIVAVAIVVLTVLSIVATATVSSGGDEGAHEALRVARFGLDGAGAGNGGSDWIELENTGDEALNLNNYALFLLSDIREMYQFPNVSLASGEKLTLCADGTELPFRLPRAGGDALILLNAKGRRIDSVEFPELAPYAVGTRGTDDSWTVSGAEGENGEIVKVEEPEIVRDVIEISEAMSDNTLYGELRDYIELHNSSSSTVDLSGWTLSDDAGNLRKWSFPQDTFIPGGGYLAIYCTDGSEGGLHASFALSKQGESVWLCRPDGACVCAVSLPALNCNQAYSLIDGAWSTELAPTPGAQNSINAAMEINAARFPGSPVRISEFKAANTNTDKDWIELRNMTDAPVDLSGYGLSDNAAKPRKWTFPQGTVLQPGAYTGVLCVGDEEYKGQQLAADFKLSDDGGYTVCVAKPDGEIIDAIYAPMQYADLSYGRDSNGKGLYYFETPTPLNTNDSVHAPARAKSAAYSVAGGCYQSGQSFSVELSAEPGSRIYYTLDCTDVDESSTLYTSPIPVSGTTILRTRVYRDGAVRSIMDAQSYLFDIANPDGVYIVSLVIDEKYLTSPELGLFYANPASAYDRDPINNYMQDLEREGHMELFKGGTQQVLSQECGFKLQGFGSRTLNPKAFKLVARSAYGKNRFSYPVFSKRDYDEYQSLVLRLSGQDYSRAFMRDSTLAQLARGTSVMYMENELSVVYLNGEYYCLMYLRERINPFSICRHEGWEGMENDIDLIYANETVLQGSNAGFEELLDWIRTHDMSTDEAYAYLDKNIDIQNYIEWMAIEMFAGNGDMLNSRRYRNTKTDGKWRWVLFDLDRGFLMDTDSMRRWLDPEGMGSNKNFDTTLFIGCMSNPIFRDRFLSYLGDKMATDWTGDRMAAMFDEALEKIRNYMGDYLNLIGVSPKKYQENFEELRQFALDRPRKFIERSAKQLNLSDADKEKYFGEALRINPEVTGGWAEERGEID